MTGPKKGGAKLKKKTDSACVGVVSLFALAFFLSLKLYGTSI
jgi:hypothetical protein